MSGFVTLRMVTLPPEREADSVALARALQCAGSEIAGVKASWAAPTLGGVAIHAGQVIWRTTFATESDALAATRDPVWAGQVAPLLEGTGTLALGYCLSHLVARPAGHGLWRALLFHVRPDASPSAIEALEQGLLLMPNHVRTIRSRALSRTAFVEEPRAFSHVWEQEFDGLDGLTGDYMSHPIHWAHVDAFFDADCPDYIVDPHFIQIAALIDEPILT